MLKEMRGKILGGPGALNHFGAVAVSRVTRGICEDRITRVLVSSEHPVDVSMETVRCHESERKEITQHSSSG